MLNFDLGEIMLKKNIKLTILLSGIIFMMLAYENCSSNMQSASLQMQSMSLDK